MGLRDFFDGVEGLFLMGLRDFFDGVEGLF